MSVIINTDGLARGKSLGCRLGKCLTSCIIKSQGNNDFLVAHIILLIARFGVCHLGTGDNSVSIGNDLVKFLGQDILHTAVLGDTELIILVSCIICLTDKVQ